MKLFSFGERRKGERRKVDRGEVDRRERQRRKFFRIVYPPTAEPRVLNGDFRIVDISQEGVRFACKNGRGGSPERIEVNSTVDLTIQFQDGEILDIRVKILRCDHKAGSGERVFAGIVKEGISPERISKEQTYLLKHFPEFCRASYTEYL